MIVQKSGEWYALEQNNDVEVNSNEEKVSPKAQLIIKKYYELCSHTTKEYVELPQEMVNMTEEDVKEEYADFEVESFSANEIVLYKKEKGMCSEHYVLRPKDNIVAIYRIEEDGTETLIEETGISIEYLTQTDLINIQNGMKVYGKEKLNSIIEDFE